MAFEMINSKDKNNGLIKKLVQEDLKDEMIARIVADFIIAAGDTVCKAAIFFNTILTFFTQGWSHKYCSC